MNIITRVWNLLQPAPQTPARALSPRALRELDITPNGYTDGSGAASGYATIRVLDLRARDGPSTSADIIGAWPQGARVIVWAMRTDGWCWLEAENGGLSGWSFAGSGYWELDK